MESGETGGTKSHRLTTARQIIGNHFRINKKQSSNQKRFLNQSRTKETFALNYNQNGEKYSTIDKSKMVLVNTLLNEQHDKSIKILKLKSKYMNQSINYVCLYMPLIFFNVCIV